MPASLSAIILHLLEKDPDNRYQSAAGVLYDLERLPDPEADLDQQTAGTRVGAHDVPVRLLRRPGWSDATARSALRGSFAAALAGQCCGVLISGAPGVGKTALADELRPDVTGNGGWFVTGKFDLHRRDLEFDATRQAFRALGRLLLAEPEAELAKVRMRILAAVGSNAGLLTAMVPEFAALLRVPPDPGDPLTAQARAKRTAARALRAIASGAAGDDVPRRPAVGRDDAAGLRGPDADRAADRGPAAGGGLSAGRGGRGAAAGGPAGALAESARGAPPAAGRPAGRAWPPWSPMCCGPGGRRRRTWPTRSSPPHGNPYETVELLNALRRHGMLAPAPVGWRWQEEAVQARLRRSEAAALQTARLAAMPEQTRGVVQAMACLGGRAELRLLRVATGADADDVAGAGAGHRGRPAGARARSAGARSGAISPRPAARGDP